MIRVTANIALIISFLFLPWWVTALVAFLSCFLFTQFIEAALFGVIYDVVYSGGTMHSGLIFGGICFLISLWAPKSIIIYAPWGSKD